METLFIFTAGLIVGVVFEKQLKKYKEAAVRAAKAARNEFDKN